jgi:hypothetical protein
LALLKKAPTDEAEKMAYKTVLIQFEPILDNKTISTNKKVVTSKILKKNIVMRRP